MIVGLRCTYLCLALVAAVGGCGWISGLDNLSVDASTNDDDASESGPTDAAGGDSSDDNVASDGESADASCALTMTEMACFGIPCPAGLCCLTAVGATCTNSCVGIAFDCVSASQCLASDGGNVCCLAHIVEPAGQPCPYALTATSGTSATKTTATCVSAASCSGTAGENVRMCSDNAECPLAETCVKATLSTDPSVIFGVCQ